jgi:hypothetical protein
MIKIVPRNRPDCEILIDEADAERVRPVRWAVVKRKGVSLYAAGHVNGRQVYLHRFIMKADAGQMINHLDGNGLNCQRANMVFCTYTENNQHAATLPGRKIRGPRHESGKSRNTVRRKLTDGSVRVYVYDRLTGEVIERFTENKS